MALADQNGMSNIDQVGLALSYLGDAANQMSGRPTGYAAANLQSLKALQDQLLRTQQIKKAQAAQTAQAKLTGSLDPSTGITWDQPTAPTGNFQQLEDTPPAANGPDANQSPAAPANPSPAKPADVQAPAPGLANAQPLPNAAPGVAATAPIPNAPGLANSSTFTLHSLAENTPEANEAFNQVKSGLASQRALLAQAYPDEVGKMMVSNAFAAPTPVTTAEGARTDFVDKNGHVVSTISGADKEPEKVKEVVALFGPDWKSNPKAIDYYNKVTMPMSVSLSANTQGENAFEKAQGEEWGKEAAGLGPAANLARDRISSVQQFMALSDQVKTGKLTPTLAEVSGWAQAVGVDPSTLGIDPKTASAAQVMDKIQNRLAMQNIGPGGLPANNFSEADRKFVQATTVNKANTPEANKLIAQIGIAADKRTIDKEQSWLSARQKGINYPAWKQQWNKYVQDTPMFPKMETPEQAAALPSGTMFTDGDGKIRVRP